MNIGIIFLILLMCGFIGACASEGKPPKRLHPKPRPRLARAPEDPPRVQNFRMRMEAVGIHAARAYEGMGSFGIETQVGGKNWCPFAMLGSEWLGQLFTVPSQDLRRAGQATPETTQCVRCRTPMDHVLFEIVRSPVPTGTIDLRVTEPRLLGTHCSRCGDFGSGRAVSSQVLGEIWTAQKNFFGLIEAMEGGEASLKLRQAELACLQNELDDVERRRNQLNFEQLRIKEELGMLDGHPDRDRFEKAPPAAPVKDAPEVFTGPSSAPGDAQD